MCSALSSLLSPFDKCVDNDLQLWQRTDELEDTEATQHAQDGQKLGRTVVEPRWYCQHDDGKIKNIPVVLKVPPRRESLCHDLDDEFGNKDSVYEPIQSLQGR